MPYEPEEKRQSVSHSDASFSPGDSDFDISRFRCPHCGSLSVEALRDEPVVSGIFRIFKCKKCGKEFGRFVGRS